MTSFVFLAPLVSAAAPAADREPGGNRHPFVKSQDPTCFVPIVELLGRIPATKAFDILFDFAVSRVVATIDEINLIQLQVPTVRGIEKPSLLDRLFLKRESVSEIRPSTREWNQNAQKYRDMLARKGLGSMDIVRIETRLVMSGVFFSMGRGYEVGKPLPDGWDVR